MPLSGCTVGTVSGATVSFGPWVSAIQVSCGSSPCPGNLNYTNNGPDGFDARAFTENSSTGLTLTSLRTPFTDPLGTTHTNTTGHIQTWNGSSGFAVPRPFTIDWAGQAAGGNPSSVSGYWPAYWALGNDNVWPGSGGTGGELDIAEFGSVNCSFSLYDGDTYGGGATVGSPVLSPSGTYIGVTHQYTLQLLSNGNLTWYLDGSSFASASGYVPNRPFYPMVDAEVSSACSTTFSFPITTIARAVRVYQPVSSNACYSTVPAYTTAAARGPCPASGQYPAALSVSPSNSFNVSDATPAGTLSGNVTVATSDGISYTGWLTFDDTGVCGGGTYGPGNPCSNGPFTGAYPDGNSSPTAGTPRFLISPNGVISAGRTFTQADDGTYPLAVVAQEGDVPVDVENVR